MADAIAIYLVFSADIYLSMQLRNVTEHNVRITKCSYTQPSTCPKRQHHERCDVMKGVTSWNVWWDEMCNIRYIKTLPYVLRHIMETFHVVNSNRYVLGGPQWSILSQWDNRPTDGRKRSKSVAMSSAQAACGDHNRLLAESWLSRKVQSTAIRQFIFLFVPHARM